MKASLFSPILILLIITLFAKASMLFGRIQEHTTYSNISTSSVLLDTAYANPHGSSDGHSRAPAAPEMKSKNSAINNMTRSEMNLLKELAKRREKLEKDKKDLNTREQILNATENKIDQKVLDLKALQVQLEELMKKYEQKENSKILSLVKIYETMKPKDAAKIFNELEMPVLLKVVSNMKEVRVAPVIASMEPTKARELSIELSKQKPLD